MSKKQNRGRLAAALAAVIMCAAALTGCNAVVNDPVVAKVGDVEVSYSMFASNFSNYAQFGLIDTTTPEGLAEGREMIMDMMVRSVVPTAMAHKQGLTLTEEELAETKALAAEMVDSYLVDFQDPDADLQDEAVKAAAIAAFDKAYKSAGITYASLLEDMETDYIDNMLASKLIEQLYATIPDPTDAEIEARYNEELEADKKAYAEDPGAYYTDSQNAGTGTLRPLMAPDGLYYVKHILINNSENAPEEDKDRDYRVLAEEVLGKVKAGEDFDALITEYNEDPGMESNPDGYIIGPTFEGIYDEAFQTAAGALKAQGDTTELVESSYGLHVIRREADVPTDVIPLEDVKEEISDIIRMEKESELYASTVEQWQSELSITIYDKRVQYVGVQ